MKIQHILFTIADNRVSGVHLHVLLDTELPADTKLWTVLHLPIGLGNNYTASAPYYVTGVRSPASRCVTVQLVSEALIAARNQASNLQGVSS